VAVAVVDDRLVVEHRCTTKSFELTAGECMQSEVRPAVLVRPAIECSAVRSDAALDHNSELIADVSSPLIQCLPPDSAATVQQSLQLQSCPQELYLMSTPKASLSNVLYFRDGGPEEDLKAGESSMDRQTSQASTLTLTDVDLSTCALGQRPHPLLQKQELSYRKQTARKLRT